MITSVRNRGIVAAARLQKRGIRDQHRRFLVEGAPPVGEAVAAGAAETLFHVPGAGGRIADLVRRAGEAGVTLTPVAGAVMAHLTSTVTPQPVAAIARFVDVDLADLTGAEGLVAVLCAVRDPGNAGTIVRAADASGAAGVVFSEASVDVYNAKTVRASAGSLFHLPIVREAGTREAVEALRTGGARILAATAEGSSNVYESDLTGPTVVMLGNEAWGLPPELRDLADDTVRVPIEGQAESLNLAAAATVVMFEAARQRRVAASAASAIADAAHDLRSPLVGVKGFSSTLVARWDGLDDAQRREAVTLISFDAERGGAMLELVIALARAESGRVRRRGSARLEKVGRAVTAVFARIDERPDVSWSAAGEVALDASLAGAIAFALSDIVGSLGGVGPVEVAASREPSSVTVTFERSGGRSGAQDDASLPLVRRVVEALGGHVDATGSGFAAFLPR